MIWPWFIQIFRWIQCWLWLWLAWLVSETWYQMMRDLHNRCRAWRILFQNLLKLLGVSSHEGFKSLICQRTPRNTRKEWGRKRITTYDTDTSLSQIVTGMYEHKLNFLVIWDKDSDTKAANHSHCNTKEGWLKWCKVELRFLKGLEFTPYMSSVPSIGCSCPQHYRS